MKLNLGSGAELWDGYINLDAKVIHAKGKHTNVVSLIQSLPFKPNSFTEISCIHAIEHFYFNDAVQVLKDCFMLLKPKGRLIVEGPCIVGSWEIYVNRKNNIKRFIDFVYGGENNRLKFGNTYAHRSGWTAEIMAEVMQRVGFNITRKGIGFRHGMGIRDFGVMGEKK